MSTHKSYVAKVPTNIAFLKYWGKQDSAKQWPANDSLSMTLDLFTETKASISKQAHHSFALNSQEPCTDERFLQKPLKHLENLAQQFGFAAKLEIQTHNSFPSSCGIASSASGLGALTLAALAAWTASESFEELESKGFSLELIARLAAQGSGSACRSFWGGFVKWQKGSSPSAQKALAMWPQSHWQLTDTILVMSSQAKKISSTEAHQDAWTSLLFAPRLAILSQRLQQMESAIAAKDLKTLGPLLEQEALEMHAVMMSAQPASFFMNQDSSRMLAWLRNMRKKFALEAYFTMDAGPNIHLIHPSKQLDQVKKLLSEAPFRIERLLHSPVGSGPQICIQESHHGYLENKAVV